MAPAILSIPQEDEANTQTQEAPTYDEIARLAHSYWLSRKPGEGSAEEDWLRAERELQSRKGQAESDTSGAADADGSGSLLRSMSGE